MLIEIDDLPADHHAYDIGGRDAAQGFRADPRAVPEHRDPVCQLPYLFHAVRDVDHPDPILMHLLDQSVKLEGLRPRQGGGRLIKHQYFCVFTDGAGDLDHLLTSDAQRTERRLRVDVRVNPVQLLPGLPEHPFAIENTGERGRFLAEKQIFRHRHIGNRIQLLMDDGDAIFARISWRANINLLPVDIDRAAIALLVSGEDLHQRGFTRAVFPHQGMDLSGE